MNTKDFIGPPCSCGECVQAGMSQYEQVRDPLSGAWLHGYALKHWYDARERFRDAARAAVGDRGRHGGGFEKLVKK